MEIIFQIFDRPAERRQLIKDLMDHYIPALHDLLPRKPITTS